MHPPSQPSAPLAAAPACDDPVEELLALHSRMFLALQRPAIPHWVELELTMAQFKTIIVLSQLGPLTINRLADLLEVTQPTASHLVDRLAQVGLCERVTDPQDRRRAPVQLSVAGWDLIATLHQGGQAQLRSLMQRVDPDAQQALVRGMRALLAAAEARER